MKHLHHIILLIAGLLAILIYIYWSIIIPSGFLQNIRITQTYAFIAIALLYFTLLPDPLYYSFANLPLKLTYLKARRELGVSSFLFALLHACFGFFGLLGGFGGVSYLSQTYIVALSLSATALVILCLMTIASFAFIKQKMGKGWYVLQKLVYVAGMCILVHMLLLGTHFSDLTQPIPEITFAAVLFLLILESVRFDGYIQKRFATLPRFGIVFVTIVSALSILSYLFFFPNNKVQSLNVHAAHITLAKQAQQSQTFAVDISKIPGLDGDRTKRYTVSMFADPANPQPNEDTTIRFRIFDASTGNPVNYFKFIYAMKMHLIIVNSSLTYFRHIHPTQQGQDFVIATQFPANDVYHMYIEFQPYGGIEQQMAFTIPVGNVQPSQSTQPADADNTTKTFGNYLVALKTYGRLYAQQMSFGSQQISFTIRDATTKQPVTNLKPYLASFGHLTMINESTYDFIHVHPYSLFIPPPDANGGPNIDFLPIGIYGPFKPGIYRAFAEFNPDGKLITADFTLNVH